MEGYKVKQQLKSALENEDAASLDPLLAEAKDHLLRWRDLQKYARIAIAGPATVSLRAMLRVVTPRSLRDRLAFLAGAAKAGLGFRTLFNQPLSLSTVNQVFKSGA